MLFVWLYLMLKINILDGILTEGNFSFILFYQRQ